MQYWSAVPANLVAWRWSLCFFGVMGAASGPGRSPHLPLLLLLPLPVVKARGHHHLLHPFLSLRRLKVIIVIAAVGDDDVALDYLYSIVPCSNPRTGHIPLMLQYRKGQLAGGSGWGVGVERERENGGEEEERWGRGVRKGAAGRNWKGGGREQGGGGERDGGREIDWGREGDKETESEWVSVRERERMCVCVCEKERERTKSYQKPSPSNSRKTDKWFFTTTTTTKTNNDTVYSSDQHSADNLQVVNACWALSTALIVM